MAFLPEPEFFTYCESCGQSMPTGPTSAILNAHGKKLRDPWTREGSVWHLPFPAPGPLQTWIAKGRMFGEWQSPLPRA